MVNAGGGTGERDGGGSPTLAERERALAIGYAPGDAQDGLRAVFALDATLGAILKTTREPIVGQMRLTWWYEALGRLDTAPPPAEPVLQALAAHVVRLVPGAALAEIAEGWEALLETPLEEAAIERFAARRGGLVFTAAARLLGVEDSRIAVAGEGWALADLALRLSDQAQAEEVAQRARERLERALDRTGAGRWPTRARALGALALLARADVDQKPRPAGSPRRIGRLLLHRLVGY